MVAGIVLGALFHRSKPLVRYRSIRDLTPEHLIYGPKPQAGDAAIGVAGSMASMYEVSQALLSICPRPARGRRVSAGCSVNGAGPPFWRLSWFGKRM